MLTAQLMKENMNVNRAQITVIGKKKLKKHMRPHETFECGKCGILIQKNSKSENSQCDQCAYTLNRKDNLRDILQFIQRVKKCLSTNNLMH